MEYREGKGMVLFCQMDVTGRTETDPAAQTLTANLLEYVSEWKPSPRREALYAGEPAGARTSKRRASPRHVHRRPSCSRARC